MLHINIMYFRIEIKFKSRIFQFYSFIMFKQLAILDKFGSNIGIYRNKSLILMFFFIFFILRVNHIQRSKYDMYSVISSFDE